jgi:dTDP-glucose pyrophosphorylase
VSILEIENFIIDNEPYIVSYCDLTQKWDYQNFLSTMKETNCDGCLVTHTGKHPHRLKVLNFAHVLLNGQKVLKVKEKGYFTNDPMSEYASNGIYYFKHGDILKKYCHKIIETKEVVNGEYYVTLIYNQMIKDGLNVIHYPTDNYVCLGSPHELIAFKYWKTLIDQNISEEDIKFIQTYWKKYHVIGKK